MFKKQLLFIILFFISFKSSLAQFAASPYSLFGIGKMSDAGLTYHDAMGGLGISNGKYWVLNNVNPALLPMNTFTTFDLGLFAERRSLVTTDLTQNNTNGGLRNLAIAFPVKELKWSMAFGLMPYSDVSYNMSTSSPVVNREEATANYTYQGDGGINQVYLSSGWQLIPKFLSAGIRASYAFGSITNETIIEIQERVFTDEEDEVGTAKSFQPSRYFISTRYSDLLFEGGLNLKKDFKKNLALSLGFVYEFGANMKTTKEQTIQIYNPSEPDSITARATGNTYLPPKYGLGLSLTKLNKWTFGVDFYTRDWALFKSDFQDSDELTKNYKIIVGGEFTPDMFSVTSYLKRATFLFGFSAEQTSIFVNNTNINDFGINFGLSLPVGNASIFNLGLKFGQLGTTSNGLIREDYFKLNLGMTFNDRSFGWYRNQNKFK